MAYQCKDLEQNQIVCEYEENLSTNGKVITEKTKLSHKLLKNNFEYQGHLMVKVTMLHVGEKVLTLTTLCVRIK